jgi:hypothetical protein
MIDPAVTTAEAGRPASERRTESSLRERGAALVRGIAKGRGG